MGGARPRWAGPGRGGRGQAEVGRDQAGPSRARQSGTEGRDSGTDKVRARMVLMGLLVRV